MFRTVVLALMGCVMSSIVAHAAGWDARTRLTNTAVTGAHVQQTLNAGKSALHGFDPQSIIRVRIGETGACAIS